MTGQYILSDYLNRALSQAEYDKLEDWVLVDLKLGHDLPIMNN